MDKLGELYADFSRIDLDTRGGYARVAKVKTQGGKGIPEYCAFKLMRHDLESPQRGIIRFEGEIKTLVEITRKDNYPSAITQIYDSGFAPIELLEVLRKPRDLIDNSDAIEDVNPELEIISTGTDLQKFLNARSDLVNKNTSQWLPYLVVELAPYNDNLLRQIRQLSSGNTSDLYRLPTHEIISMALQVLEVIDYLHKKHNFAYMDWKPEHVYWNGLKLQLKLIDWNVTHQFKDDRERKQFIREDIRLFCGAVLYCSLALNDPEDLNRPIGPKPKSTSSLFSIPEPRYWTDNPIFYERDFILDDKIKRIIQKGLDPKQGFDSPQELKNELLKYAEQELSLSASELSTSTTSQEKFTDTQKLLADADDTYFASEYDRAIQLYQHVLRLDPINKRARDHLARAEAELKKQVDTDTRLPRHALQLYRQARSYIAARDYQEARKMLDTAIALALAKDIDFPQAKQLLAIVKTSIEVEDVERKINPALEKEQWDNALALYREVIKLDPSNGAIKKDFDNLHELLDTEAKLKKLGLQKIFTRLGRIQNLTEAVKEFLNPDNSLLKSVEKQISQIKLARLRYAIVLMLTFIISFQFLGKGIGYLFPPINTPTLIPTPTTSLADLSTRTSTAIAETITPVPVTISPTASETLTPTPILVTLGKGYITLGKVSAWDTPNGKFIENLTLNQVVTILEKVNDHGTDWYRCTWEIDGTIKEGWILAEYIVLGAPPTPKP